jgi:hypothetical protein
LLPKHTPCHIAFTTFAKDISLHPMTNSNHYLLLRSGPNEMVLTPACHFGMLDQLGINVFCVKGLAAVGTLVNLVAPFSTP